MKTGVLVVAMLAVAGTGGWYFRWRDTALEVPLVAVRHGPVEETVTATSVGSVRPRREALLSAEVAGRIVSLRRREGDSVEAGEEILLLDRTDLQAALAAAEADVAVVASLVAEARLTAAQADDDYARIHDLHGHVTAPGTWREGKRGNA